MPLSMWEKQGADTKLIEANTMPCDIRWNNQLGWTYRVCIESEQQKRRLTQVEAMQLAGSKKRRNLKKQKKSSSSDSTTSSSSDSSEKTEQEQEQGQEQGQGQEQQESVAERKAREKREQAEARAAAAKAKAKAKAAAKASAKVQKAVATKAQKIRPKVLSTLNALRATIAHHLIFDVPEAVSGPCRHLIQVFERLLSTLDGVIRDHVNEWPSCLGDIPFSDAKKAEQLLLAMIKGVAAAKGIKM